MVKFSPPIRTERDCPDCRFDGLGNRRSCLKCATELELTKYVVLRILEVDPPRR